MAGTNDFKAIATGAGANVITQSAFASLTSFLANGYSSGVVDSDQLNKVLRQSSFIAAVIGQVIADANINAVDDGDVSGFVTDFISAISSNLLGGSSQTWQTVTGSRVLETTYTNSTGRPILVNVFMQSTTTGQSPTLTINGTVVLVGTGQQNSGQGMAVFALVPNGATYSAAPSSGSATLSKWSELR